MAFKSVRGNLILIYGISLRFLVILKSSIDFSEQLKLLGYQDNIPLSILSTFSGNENSFRAYGNILIWLIKNFDPDAMVHEDSHTETDRVMLVRTATEFLVNRSFDF